MNGDPDYVSLENVFSATPVDQALETIFGEYHFDRPGGASARGWSNRGLLLACPYKYKRLVLDSSGEKTPELRRADALEIGGLVHQLQALYNILRIERRVVDHNPALDVVLPAVMPVWKPRWSSSGFKRFSDFPFFDPEWLKRRLLAEGVSGEVVMEAYRLYDAHQFRYEDDYVVPLAVELLSEDKTGNTCRYDTIAHVLPNDDGFPPGTCIVEMKTAARFDAATLEGWRNDGQILHQIMLWDRGMERTFGKLQGVIVDIIGKQKTPEFHRTMIPPLRHQIRGHVRDLRVWDAVEGVFRATGTWPRNRKSCVGRFGMCELFDHCSGDTH